MNIDVRPALTMDGTEQQVAIPRGYTLILYAVDNPIELRSEQNSANYLTVPANDQYPYPHSLGQTITLKGTAGTVVQIAFN